MKTESIFASTLMPEQNLRRVTKALGDPDYWLEYAKHLPSRAKTQAAAEVAVELDNRGAPGVTPEIARVLTKVISLARGA